MELKGRFICFHNTGSNSKDEQLKSIQDVRFGRFSMISLLRIFFQGFLLHGWKSSNRAIDGYIHSKYFSDGTEAGRSLKVTLFHGHNYCKCKYTKCRVSLLFAVVVLKIIYIIFIWNRYLLPDFLISLTINRKKRQLKI